MKKLTHRLFIRRETENEYRNWDDLEEEEAKYISECMTKDAARACRLVASK